MGMSDKKINQVLDIYEERVSKFDPVALSMMMPAILDADQRQAARDAIAKLAGQIDHVREMIPKIRGFLVQGRREKAFRWLGFIQGVFYSVGIYTIEDMANHNRPTKDDVRERHPDHSFDAYGCAECSKLVKHQKGCDYAEEFHEALGPSHSGN